jgi:hypothetical protein
MKIFPVRVGLLHKGREGTDMTTVIVAYRITLQKCLKEGTRLDIGFGLFTMKYTSRVDRKVEIQFSKLFLFQSSTPQKTQTVVINVKKVFFLPISLHLTGNEMD